MPGSRILAFQTFKNRTLGIRSAFRTSLHQFPQYLLHGLKRFDFAFNVSNLRFRSASNFAIVCLWRHTQCQQLANFAKRKAKPLCTFDKFQPPAFGELQRVLGEGKLKQIFFYPRSQSQSIREAA
jgi:hypothetical protein